MDREYSEKRRIWEFADEVYIFPPDLSTGIMFYSQEDMEKLLPGYFLSSGEKIVKWDESINGEKRMFLPVTDDVSCLINRKRMLARRSEKYGGGVGEFDALTIVTSLSNFLSLLKQLEDKNFQTSVKGNTILNVNSEVIDYTLDPKQK